MTKLTEAMVRMLAMVPDPPNYYWVINHHSRVTLYCLERRGLVSSSPTIPRAYTRTPFGRETAERLARGAK